MKHALIESATKSELEAATEAADWALDAVATATQDRRYLRSDEAYDAVAGEAILANAKLACIQVMRKETARLRACLEHTRDEICEGPVDDVLWHSAVPACTTVDNITLALDDGWTYDGWLDARQSDDA